MMAIKIGYLADTVSSSNGTLASEPAFHPRRPSPVQGKKTKRCPAISDYNGSAFDIYVPYNMTFVITRNNDIHLGVSIDHQKTTVEERWLRSCFEMSFADEGTVQLGIHPFWMFISDEPDVIVTQLPAHNQTNPHPIRGQFNCYNWFRPITYAFEFESGKEINITSDSPIFQVKFYHPTESNFVLQECEMTPNIAKIADGSGLRSFNRKTKWNKVFEFSGQRRPKKVLQFSERAHLV